MEVKPITASVSLDNQVNLPKDWWFNLYSYGQSRVTYGNRVNLPFSLTSVSWGKKVMNGKGNISVSVNDIFLPGYSAARRTMVM